MRNKKKHLKYSNFLGRTIDYCKKSSLVIIICIFNKSCNTKENNFEYLNIVCSQNAAFSIDSITIKQSFSTIENDNYLTIRPINKSSDTFSLTIESYPKNQLKIFEFTNHNHKSSFKIYTFPLVPKKIGNILFDKTKDDLKNYTRSFESNKKVKAFVSVLERNHILELPDCSKIQNYPIDETLSSPVWIEYSNKCIYKMIMYNDPFTLNKIFKEAKAISNLLEYLKSEFDY